MLDQIPAILEQVGPEAGLVFASYIIFGYRNRQEIAAIRNEMAELRGLLDHEKEACSQCREDLRAATERLNILQSQMPFLTSASNPNA